MKKIEVDFEMGQIVKIKFNQTVGKIIGIWVDIKVTHYSVEWVTTTSAINERWFVKEEIAELDPVINRE